MIGKLSNLFKMFLWVLYHGEAEIQHCTAGSSYRAGGRQGIYPTKFTLINKHVILAIFSLKHNENLRPFFKSPFQAQSCMREIRMKCSRISRNSLQSPKFIWAPFISTNDPGCYFAFALISVPSKSKPQQCWDESHKYGENISSAN